MTMGWLSRRLSGADERTVKTVNIVLLSAGFFFLFTAFFTMANIQVWSYLTSILNIFSTFTYKTLLDISSNTDGLVGERPRRGV